MMIGSAISAILKIHLVTVSSVRRHRGSRPLAGQTRQVRGRSRRSHSPHVPAPRHGHRGDRPGRRGRGAVRRRRPAAAPLRRIGGPGHRVTWPRRARAPARVAIAGDPGRRRRTLRPRHEESGGAPAEAPRAVFEGKVVAWPSLDQLGPEHCAPLRDPEAEVHGEPALAQLGFAGQDGDALGRMSGTTYLMGRNSSARSHRASNTPAS